MTVGTDDGTREGSKMKGKQAKLPSPGRTAIQKGGAKNGPPAHHTK